MKKISKKRLKRIRRANRRAKELRTRKSRIERLCRNLGFFLMYSGSNPVNWNKDKFCLFKGDSLISSDLIMEATSVEIESYLKRLWRLKAFL